jgi:hypothetical protein
MKKQVRRVDDLTCRPKIQVREIYSDAVWLGTVPVIRENDQFS